MYLLLRCQLSDMSGSLFSVVIVLSPLIYRMLIYIFLLLSIIIIISYNLFGTICLISGRFYPLGWPQPIRVFTALTKPILFLCHHKGFHIVIYLDDMLVPVHFQWAGKRAPLIFLFLISLGLDYILMFPSLTFASLDFLFLRIKLGYCLHVSIFTS